ncbi:hypothetical protein Fmac_025556 [Flemingia macrophylla]|uniref:Rx N-terminal domain-containing protein n=1 Tax=Flemingia macrophylla TaxID=520843 RepID=A0ABD1LSK9_9FABA
MALELVGGALLSAFLQVSFEKLASPQILDFFRGRKLDEKLLSKLEMKLQSIHALADDAEQKQFVDPRVRDWLLKVKDVVLDAEDILDEIQYELSKCEVEAEYESQTSTDSTWKVLSYFKSHSVSSSNKEIKSRMEKALDSLEFLSSQKGDLGLRNVTGVGVGSGLGSEVSQKSPSTSLVVESVIYGRDDEKEMIYNWLASNNTNKLEVDQAKNIPNIARHFSVATSHVKYFDGFGTFYDTRRLRTFLPTSESLNFIYNRWHCKMSISELFSKFKFLRVLSLSHYSNLSVVPESVGNLKHLRSLDLSNTSIYSLPESTCYLYNLQILKLNYITMIELPTNLHKLTDLRYLELIKTKVRQMPRHLEKLKNLRVFISSFDVEKGREFSMKQLGELNLQGGLSIENLQNIENLSDALVMDLKNKQHLVELELKWDRDQDPDDSMTERDEIVIEKLQPPKELEKLSINNYGGKQFPRWLSDNSLWNVVSLMLMNCQSCQYLPSLGLLPFLKHLTVARFDRLVSIDADFYGSSSCSFVSLETLSFYCMKEWEKWECESVTGSFPRLEELYIDGCPKLEGHLPMQLVHLKTLNIFCCEQLLGDDGCLGFDELFITISGHKMEAWLVEWICQMISCTSLEYLNIFSCRNMNILMSSCNNFLVTLKIHNSCDSLAAFPLDVFPKLQLLSICGCRNLQRISQDQSHNHLKDLTISNSPQFESLSECMHILPSLDVLRIEDCPKLESFPEGGLPPNLKVLFLREIPSLQCLPEGLCHLSSLQTLTLRNCSTLQFLPDDLCRLSSLKELVLNNCPNVQCLPNSGLPKSISYLEISGNCPLLRQSCLQDPTKVAQIQRTLFRNSIGCFKTGMYVHC